MKRINILLFVLSIMVLCVAVSRRKEKMPPEMPKDFNFIIAYGIGAKNNIDTFKGEYTKDLVMDGSATCKIIFTFE